MRFFSLQVSPRFLKLVATAFAILLPFIWLYHPYVMFNGDMQNMYWMTTYEGTSIRETGMDSLVFQTTGVAGIPYPIFYAWGYIVLNGVIEIFLGPVITLRLMLIGALAIQFLSILRLGQRLGLSWGISYILSIILGWSIYSLTNLYTRSDLMEYFTVCYLTSALCCLLTLIVEGPNENNPYEQVAWGFYFVLVSISHAITLVYGGILLAICGLLGLIFTPTRGALLWNFIHTFMAWGMISLAWLYLMTIFFGKVTISRWFSMAGYYSWTYIDGKSFHNAINCLWPYAQAAWEPGITQTGFDTQIATAYLIFLVGYWLIRLFFWKQVRARGNGWLLYSLAFLSFCIAVLCYFAATINEIEPYTVHLFFMMQFPYRAVTYVNLGLFITVIALLARVEFTSPGARICLRVFAGLALAYAVLGFVTKLDDALLTRSFQTNQAFSWLTLQNIKVTNGCDTFGGSADYNVTVGQTEFSLTDNPSVIVKFLPSPEPNLSSLDPQVIDLKQRCIVATQIMCFPWNKLYANGVEIQGPDLGYATTVNREQPTWAFWLNPGHYTLTCDYEPDSYYVFLRCVALVGFLIWLPLYLKEAGGLVLAGIRRGWAWGTALLGEREQNSRSYYMLQGCLGVLGIRLRDDTQW